MKITVSVLLGLLFVPVLGLAQPDNMYLRAMKDEMNRTRKELRTPGGPKPFFIAYRLTQNTRQEFGASLGAPYAAAEPVTTLKASAYIYAGNARENSAGFDNEAYYYYPAKSYPVADSYDGIRQAFWELTDFEYVKAANSYEKKQAYKRRKNLPDDLPDFSSAPRGKYAEDIRPFPACKDCAELMRALSAQSKDYPFLEQFVVTLTLSRNNVYFLDSLGDYSQTSSVSRVMKWQASLRNKDGYKENLSRVLPLPDGAPDKTLLLAQTRDFLAAAQRAYTAKKAEPYLGPALLKPQAAGAFLDALFNRNVRYSRPLLSFSFETDASAGAFRDKAGMRVISHFFDVYDRPLAKEFKGQPLAGFTPVDDEGVPARELTLAEGGKLKELPTARSLIKGQKQSNGHARMTDWIYPRAALTNVFFVPRVSFSEKELKEKLLSRCRELELEYCYVFSRFPAVYGTRTGETAAAERIYTADGRREPAYGVQLTDLTPRSLRDILAAGNDAEVSYFADPSTDLETSVIAPSLLVDELEIMPSDRKPDKKPLVPMP